MLLHILPMCHCRVRVAIQLTDVKIPELGLTLREGRELRTGQPYGNKDVLVATARKEKVDQNGILIETDLPVREFTVETRWAINALRLFTHKACYILADQELEATSSDPLMWTGDEQWQGRWPARVPKNSPAALRPRLEIGQNGPKPKGLDPFLMPTLERDRILRKLGGSLPKAAFRA